MQRPRFFLLALVMLTSFAGCGSMPPVSAARSMRIAVRPLSHDGAGSTLALAEVSGKRRVAFAADDDDARIHVFDLEHRSELGSTKLDGTPGQLVIAHDGSVFVALRDRARVARYRVADVNGALAFEGDVETASEPIALALANDDRTLMVASGWGAELAVFDIEASATKLRARVPVAREPRAVIAAPNGRAVVSHATAEALTVVSFESESGIRVDRLNVRGHPAAQGFALAMIEGKVFAPQVEADPEPNASLTYYGGPTMTPVVATVEATSRFAVTNLPRGTTPPCLLPRAAAVRWAPTARLLVACMGNDQLIEYKDGVSVSRKWPLRGGVTGLAVEPTSDTVVAWAQHTRELVIARLVSSTIDGLPVDTIDATFVAASGTSGLSEELRLGRAIFHAAGDGRLSADGRACASCHPDGRDDGQVWKTPDGPRQTMMLAGRLADTAPYGWTRRANTLEAYVADTTSRLRGEGLAKDEALALQKYLLSLSAPKVNAPSSVSAAHLARIAKGKAIFESPETGCSICHFGPATTDGRRHDLGTGSAMWVDPIETPSLRFVGKSAPYFHDGRYASLRALLVAKDTKMGSTSHLRADEIDALTTYLETL